MANESGQSPEPGKKLKMKPADGLQDVLPLVYDELRAIAHKAMRQENVAHTLDATAVVNEAYLRLRDQRNLNLESRTQFFAMAATMIRRVLVDHARSKLALKRGGEGERVSLTAVDLAGATPDKTDKTIDLILIDDALKRLEKLNARSARLVEFRFFAGMSVDEAAESLGIAPRTAADEWAFAKAWLRRELNSVQKP